MWHTSFCRGNSYIALLAASIHASSLEWSWNCWWCLLTQTVIASVLKDAHLYLYIYIGRWLCHYFLLHSYWSVRSRCFFSTLKGCVSTPKTCYSVCFVSKFLLRVQALSATCSCFHDLRGPAGEAGGPQTRGAFLSACPDCEGGCSTSDRHSISCVGRQWESRLEGKAPMGETGVRDGSVRSWELSRPRSYSLCSPLSLCLSSPPSGMSANRLLFLLNHCFSLWNPGRWLWAESRE